MSEPEAAPTLLDTLHKTLNEAPAPLSLKELAKGLTKPPKQKTAEFEAAIAELLTEDLGAGKAFKNPSGNPGINLHVPLHGILAIPVMIPPPRSLGKMVLHERPYLLR